ADPGRRPAADDGEVGVRDPTPDQGKDLGREPVHALDVGRVKHGGDTQNGVGVGAPRLIGQLLSVDRDGYRQRQGTRPFGYRQATAVLVADDDDSIKAPADGLLVRPQLAPLQLSRPPAWPALTPGRALNDCPNGIVLVEHA